MIKGIEDTPAKSIKISFLATGTDVKHGFFCFIEMAIAIMLHDGLMDDLIHNSFER